MLKKYCVLHKEVIYVFHKNLYIPTIEKLSFHRARVRILGSMEFGKIINNCFHDNASKNNINLKFIMQKNSAKQPVDKYKVNLGVEIDNYQRKVLLLNIFQIKLILLAM